MPNKIEEIKSAKHPLDLYPDILRYAREGWQAITDDDKERLKWFGVFFRKPTPGHFMMRVRMPNGVASAPQLAELSAITRMYGRDVIDITTRQQVQLRWMRIEDVPDILDRLHRVGLTTMQTGLDNSRNVVGCPLAGLTAHELFDASPAVRRYHDLLLSDREFANLPRKFNVTITGCLENCTHAETQDVGLTPATREVAGETVLGFNVRVGGKMGSGGMVVGTPLDAFVPVAEGGDLCAQVTLLFARHGPRETRSRARMAFLIEDWGIDRFRAELERQWGRPLLSAGQDARTRRRSDHLGITQQRATGTYAVGLCVPVGRSSASQFGELARLAEAYGGGQVRFTIEQNVILVDVPDRALPDLLAEPLLRELRAGPLAGGAGDGELHRDRLLQPGPGGDEGGGADGGAAPGVDRAGAGRGGRGHGQAPAPAPHRDALVRLPRRLWQPPGGGRGVPGGQGPRGRGGGGDLRRLRGGAHRAQPPGRAAGAGEGAGGGDSPGGRAPGAGPRARGIAGRGGAGDRRRARRRRRLPWRTGRRGGRRPVPGTPAEEVPSRLLAQTTRRAVQAPVRRGCRPAPPRSATVAALRLHFSMRGTAVVLRAARGVRDARARPLWARAAQGRGPGGGPQRAVAAHKERPPVSQIRAASAQNEQRLDHQIRASVQEQGGIEGAGPGAAAIQIQAPGAGPAGYLEAHRQLAGTSRSSARVVASSALRVRAKP